MGGQTILTRKSRRKFARPPKPGIAGLLVRTALALLLIFGLVYLANQAMLFGLDKLLP